MSRLRLHERLSGLRHLTRDQIEHLVFWVAIVFKTSDAVLEIFAGVALVFISVETIDRIVRGLVRPELIKNPTDLIAHLILRYLGHVTPASKAFAVLYLLVHGGAKFFVVGGIWLRQLWAYPLAAIVFAGFIVYQMVLFAERYSPWMIFLTILDLIVIALLRPEYRRLKREIRRDKQ